MPAITKEIANKIDQLKEILNSQDVTKIINQVHDAMVVDEENPNSVRVALAEFIDGYAYYFSAKTSVSG